MMSERDDREAFIDAVRDFAGEDGLSRLVAARGGCYLWIPQRAFVGNWLTELIGLENAQKVIDSVTTFDADGRPTTLKFYLPLDETGERANRNKKIIELSTGGLNKREIAAHLGITERTVANALPKLSRKPRTFRAKSRNKPRIGILEIMIIDQKPDSIISVRTGFSLEKIALRRNILRSHGMLTAKNEETTEVADGCAQTPLPP